MNKNVLIGAVILILIFAGGYFLLQESSIEIDSPVSLPTLTDESNTDLIRDAFLGSGSTRCTYTTIESEYQQAMQATSYIKNGRVKVFLEGDGPMQGESLLIEDTYYFWQGDSGMKMAIEDDSLLPFGVDGDEVIIVEEEFEDISCERVSVDDDMFEIPQDVQFFDMSSGIEHFYIEE